MTISDETIKLSPLQKTAGKLLRPAPDREDFDERDAFQLIGKIYRLPVDQNQVDFGMRNPAGFDRIFDRCFFAKLPDDVRHAPFCPDEKREISMKTEPQLKGISRLRSSHCESSPR